MKKIIMTTALAGLLLLAGYVEAATVTKKFEAVVETVSNDTEVKAGAIFPGLLTFDDNDLTPDNGNFIILGDLLQIEFTFQGLLFEAVPPDQAFVINSATFSPTGSLLDLSFFADFPNRLIFSADREKLKFDFEFSKLDDEGNQITTASGTGIIREPIPDVPLPGAAWLFLSGLALLISRRKI